MFRTTRLAPVLAVAVLGCGTAHASVFTFDTAADFTNNFTQDLTGQFTHSSTGGLDNGGSVLDSDSSQIAVNKTGYDVDVDLDAGVTISTFFKAESTASGSRPLSIGLTGNEFDDYVSSLENSEASLRGTLVRSGSSGGPNSVVIGLFHDTDGDTTTGNGILVDQSSTSATLIGGSWYQLELVIGSVDGTTDQISIDSLKLNSADATGSITGNLITLDNSGSGYTVTNTALADDPFAHAFFGGQSGHNWSNLDNFSVVIPEPASLALLSLGAFGLLGRRRA